MRTGNHPIEPELIMAYLDGELPADQAVGAAAHLEQCAECRALSDELRDVSRALAAWEVEASGVQMPQEAAPLATPAKARRTWFGLPRWAWGLATAGAVMAVLGVGVSLLGPNRAAHFSVAMSIPEATAQYGVRLKAQVPGGPLNSEANSTDGALARTGPLIARTAQLQLTTRDFSHIRGRLDDVLKRHKGYFGELNVSTPTDAGRTLTGKLQIPAAELDSAMSDIKQLGHVDAETLSGEEVTAAYTDLEARLANSRHTEQRMIDLLRERTGKLSDVLEAERELGRVRGEIEQMESQRRGILTRVDFSTLNLTVNEEYKAQLHGSDSTSTLFHNAAVDGFRSMAGSVIGVALFLLSSGPVMLLWAAILFFPARFAWRRFRR